MRKSAKYLFLLFILSLSSCFEREEFTDIPSISFQDLRFIDTQSTDSLILSFSFEDETADVGLSNSAFDLFPPFQIYDLIIDAEDSVITINQDSSTIAFPLYKAPVFIENVDGQISYVYFTDEKTLFSTSDNRPAYSCDNYEIIQSDTFYIARNEFHYNFHITFEKRIGNDYEELNFREIFDNPDCSLGNFNGRIPFFDPDGKSGVFTYAMLSQAFRLAFLDNTIRARFYIYDRALNRSNEVITPDFTLPEITQ